MPTGMLVKLVHLSRQRIQPNSRLAPDPNDKSYGVIEDAEGRQVYFSHEVLGSRHSFDDLRNGQQLEFTLEQSPYLRAASVKVANVRPVG